MAIRRRLARVLVVLLGLLAAVPGVASAHEISGRFEAPLPLSLLFGAAAATVGATAVVLAFTVDVRDVEIDATLSIGPEVAAGLRAAARATFFVAFVLVVATGLLGRQVQIENFATVFVWAVWLKGIAILAAVVGSPWRVLSPWRALYDALARLEGRPIALVGSYPSWLGAAPALVAYLLWVGVAENLTAIPRSPRATALLVTGYALAMVLGGLAFGPVWFRHADALAVLYRLFGRVAPVDVTRTEAGGYRLGLRGPWRGCLRPVAGLAAAAFVVATVYTVSFDGFTSTPEYQELLFAVQDVVGSGSDTGLVLYVLGFLGFLAVFLATVALVRLAGGTPSDWRATATALAPTILPIAVAYEISHNYPFVLENLGLLGATLWSFFGLGHGPTASLLGWLSVGLFWWSQVVLIVLGHVVGVVAAHYVTVNRYDSVGHARRAHLPLVVLMIGYTVLSLWIISRPIVS